jgi:cytidyltransferase-like protein
MMAETTLAISPHPASSALNRALCREIIEHAVQHTLSKLLVTFVDDENSVPAWQRRNEEIAWYNEIHSMCVAVRRPAVNMIIVPPCPSAYDIAYGLERHREIAVSMAQVPSISTPASADTSTTTSSLFVPMDNEKAVSAFLVDDYFMYEDDAKPLPTYDLVAMGGTFDNLHAGHKRLLTAAANVCNDTLTIGVTSDAYLAGKNKSFGDMIEPCPTRIENVTEFLRTIRPKLKLDILPIDDSAGPTTKRPEFQGIVASSETLSGCRWINSVREEKSWAPLGIVIVARTDESNLSSTVIRQWKYEQQQKQEGAKM